MKLAESIDHPRLLPLSSLALNRFAIEINRAAASGVTTAPLECAARLRKSKSSRMAFSSSAVITSTSRNFLIKSLVGKFPFTPNPDMSASRIRAFSRDAQATIMPPIACAFAVTESTGLCSELEVSGGVTSAVADPVSGSSVTSTCPSTGAKFSASATASTLARPSLNFIFKPPGNSTSAIFGMRSIICSLNSRTTKKAATGHARAVTRAEMNFNNSDAFRSQKTFVTAAGSVIANKLNFDCMNTNMITRSPSRCISCGHHLGQPHAKHCGFARFTTRK